MQVKMNDLNLIMFLWIVIASSFNTLWYYDVYIFMDWKWNVLW